MSDAANALKVGVPEVEVGAAKIVPAPCETKVAVVVPAEVMGEPDTEKMFGNVIPTDDTAPLSTHERTPPVVPERTWPSDAGVDVGNVSVLEPNLICRLVIETSLLKLAFSRNVVPVDSYWTRGVSVESTVEDALIKYLGLVNLVWSLVPVASSEVITVPPRVMNASAYKSPATSIFPIGLVTPTPTAPPSVIETISLPAVLKNPKREVVEFDTLPRIVISLVCADDPFQPDPRNASADESNPGVPEVAVPVVSAITLFVAGSPANVPKRTVFMA